MKSKQDKCIECNKKKKLFRMRTPVGTLPVCSKCISKVFEIKNPASDGRGDE